MARIPSFEETLLEIYQSLGLKTYINQKKAEKQSYPSRWKKDFSDLGMSLEKYIEEAPKMLDAIFEALDMDDLACKDALVNIMEWARFHKALELRTWTGNAGQRQVLWHLLAYSYVPALARHLAFWSLHTSEHDLPPLDAGMPGGKFWFLPTWGRKNDKIELPVPQVINWLLDLLDASSCGALGGATGSKNLREKEGNDSVVRTLYNWRDGTIPKSTEKIEQNFPDDAVLNFAGTFSPAAGLSTEEKFRDALSFVSRKGLNAEALRVEIPMTVARLEAILNGSAPDEEKQEFVRLIAWRYAKPAMNTIRQRLRVARMAQDAYQRLLTFLCPDVEETCTDPARNKLLQLIVHFEAIYNLTIQAW